MERAGARDVAEQLFGTTPERRLLLLRAAWPRVVGPELARRTRVITLEGDALRIGVPDASWGRGLFKMRREILDRLRVIAGRLAPRGLGFVEGHAPLAREASEPAAPPAPAPPPPPPPALLDAAPPNADPQLRERFLASAGRYLERFRGGAPEGVTDA